MNFETISKYKIDQVIQSLYNDTSVGAIVAQSHADNLTHAIDVATQLQPVAEEWLANGGSNPSEPSEPSDPSTPDEPVIEYNVYSGHSYQGAHSIRLSKDNIRVRTNVDYRDCVLLQHQSSEYCSNETLHDDIFLLCITNEGYNNKTLSNLVKAIHFNFIQPTDVLDNSFMTKTYLELFIDPNPVTLNLVDPNAETVPGTYENARFTKISSQLVVITVTKVPTDTSLPREDLIYVINRNSYTKFRSKYTSDNVFEPESFTDSKQLEVVRDCGNNVYISKDNGAGDSILVYSPRYNRVITASGYGNTETQTFKVYDHMNSPVPISQHNSFLPIDHGIKFIAPGAYKYVFARSHTDKLVTPFKDDRFAHLYHDDYQHVTLEVSDYIAEASYNVYLVNIKFYLTTYTPETIETNFTKYVAESKFEYVGEIPCYYNSLDNGYGQGGFTFDFFEEAKRTTIDGKPYTKNLGYVPFDVRAFKPVLGDTVSFVRLVNGDCYCVYSYWSEEKNDRVYGVKFFKNTKMIDEFACYNHFTGKEIEALDMKNLEPKYFVYRIGDNFTFELCEYIDVNYLIRSIFDGVKYKNALSGAIYGDIDNTNFESSATYDQFYTSYDNDVLKPIVKQQMGDIKLYHAFHHVASTSFSRDINIMLVNSDTDEMRDMWYAHKEDADWRIPVDWEFKVCHSKSPAKIEGRIAGAIKPGSLDFIPDLKDCYLFYHNVEKEIEFRVYVHNYYDNIRLCVRFVAPEEMVSTSEGDVAGLFVGYGPSLPQLIGSVGEFGEDINEVLRNDIAIVE